MWCHVTQKQHNDIVRLKIMAKCKKPTQIMKNRISSRHCNGEVV
jgi:hypothetical protein